MPTAAFAGDLGPTAADWRNPSMPLDENEILDLRKLGFRLEPDGRVLDLELKVLDEPGFAEARRLLNAGERRQRLERLRSLLAGQPQNQPLSADVLRQARGLALGPLYAELGRGHTAGELRRLTEVDLSGVAAVFDGGSTLRTAPAVVAPDVAPASRPHFPYLTMAEQRAGENMRAAAQAELSKLEHGKLILSRLPGRDGQPNLPPILVEAIGTPARYDANRRALVLDRQLVIDELMQGVLAIDRDARRREYDRPNGLAEALAANPDIARRVIAAQDVLIAHELVHAWQDRRDPLFRQMKRGSLPNALVLEYEEEAFVEKNLYLHEKLKKAPGAHVDATEMADYRAMIQGYSTWKRNLFQTYATADPTKASDLDHLRAMQERRLEEARSIVATTDEEQRKKAARMRRLTQSALSLQSVQTAHSDRIAALTRGDLATATAEHTKVMARHEFTLAINAGRESDRAAHLQRAERYAIASGDAALIREIQSWPKRDR